MIDLFDPDSRSKRSREKMQAVTTLAKESDTLIYDEKTSAISAYGPARSTIKGAPLSSEELRKIDAYWRANLYLSLGMLYLKENPLLREPLALEQTKPRLLGHWVQTLARFYLHPFQSPDQQIRSERNLYFGTRTQCTRSAVQRLPRRYVLRSISGQEPGPRRAAALFQAVQFSRRDRGNINTPLELAIQNQTDRFSLAIDAIDRMPRFHVTGAGVREALLNQQIAAKSHAHEFGIDPKEITDWQWPF
jgi:hypothetical protein